MAHPTNPRSYEQELYAILDVVEEKQKNPMDREPLSILFPSTSKARSFRTRFYAFRKALEKYRNDKAFGRLFDIAIRMRLQVVFASDGKNVPQTYKGTVECYVLFVDQQDLAQTGDKYGIIGQIAAQRDQMPENIFETKAKKLRSGVVEEDGTIDHRKALFEKMGIKDNA